MTRRAGGPCRTRRRSRSRRCGEEAGSRRGLAQPNAASPGGNGGCCPAPSRRCFPCAGGQKPAARETFALRSKLASWAALSTCSIRSFTTRMSASFRAVRSRRRFMASSASGLAREPERTGHRCRISGARFYCGLRAWHSTTANLLFPAPVPAKPDVARGRPTSLRHSTRRVPSWESLLVAATSRLTSLPAPASQPMCGCGVSGVLRRNLRRRTRSPARRWGRHPRAFARHRRPWCPYP